MRHSSEGACRLHTNSSENAIHGSHGARLHASYEGHRWVHYGRKVGCALGRGSRVSWVNDVACLNELGADRIGRLMTLRLTA